MEMASAAGLKCCVIGAGPTGISVAKRLKDHGIAYDCFEASDDIGGNWYYQNPNGMSACYASLHIDTSKWRLAFEDFPVPEQWPDYPHHSTLLGYLNDYVDHFRLRETITFNTRVTRAHREEDGSWTVDLSTGETRCYDVMLVCNGHHWDPRLPEPAYPGHFDGQQIHSHSYRSPFEPIDMRGKRVLVVGAGNSAMDIASELAQRYVAGKLVVSMRRGVWVFNKYRNGKPADKMMMPPWMPKKLGLFLARRAIAKNGRMEDYGLPTPDHRPLEAHGSVSGEFLLRAGSGDLTVKGAIDRLDGDKVWFADGSNETFDVIVWATGYRISFPFFDQDQFRAHDNKLPLYKRMMVPGIDNLFYMGLAQPLPTLVNFAEQQSKLVVAYLLGGYAPPGAAEMADTIVRDEELHKGHYYDSPRHTIQIDFGIYVRDLRREIVRGAARARKAPLAPAGRPRESVVA